jgi:alpha-glucosidase
MANNPLLLAVRVPAVADPAQRLAMERALAVMLLGSRSAVLLEYGQELGLDSVGKSGPLMQWTPTNLTRTPPPPVEAEKPAPSPNAGYATFLPWVKPLPKDFFPPPVMPVVEESDQPTPVDVAALPGFTAGNFDAALAAPNGATANVATEMYEPGSLLNLYRQLIRLHHGNATVRSGAQTVLNRDAQGALVWVRRAPASSRTSTTVVVACNLSDRPVVLGDLGAVTVNFMRSLLNPAPGDLLKVEPGGVVVGETR